MYLINVTSGLIIASDVRSVRNPLARMVGLLNRGTVAPSEGIWLTDCPAVHTFAMRATIDLIFLDGAGKVLGTTAAAPRNRPFFSCRGARAVVELGAGSRLDLAVAGDVLALTDREPHADADRAT
jgi:uncharacterized membrane protein (UPF0127 family)